MGYRNSFTNKIIVDAGSENLRISHKGKIVFNEPSCISIEDSNKKISGLGNSVIQTDRQVKPVNRVLFDFLAFEQLLRLAIKTALNTKSWLPVNYKMYFTIPYSTSEVEKRAYRDSAEHAGARTVHLIYQPNAIAVGMRLLQERKNFILIDFGASKIEMTGFAESIIIGAVSSPTGTWKFKKLVNNYFRIKLKIQLEDKAVEMLMHKLFNTAHQKIDIQGQEIFISDIEGYIMPYFRIIQDDFLELIEQIERSPHFHSIRESGVFISGGGIKYKGLMNQILNSQEFGEKAKESENPFLDNINGATKMVNHLSEFQSLIFV